MRGTRPVASAVGAMVVAGLACGALTLAAGGAVAPVRTPLVPYAGAAASPASGPSSGGPTAGRSAVAVAVVPLAGAVSSTPRALPTPTGCAGAAAVPDVSRLGYPDSSRALLAAGFPGVDVAEHSGSVPLGGTLSTSPAAGSVRPCGTGVTLVYSSGPAPVPLSGLASGPAAGPGLRALGPPLCTLPPAGGRASALLGRLRGLVADDRRTPCALPVTRVGAYAATVPAGDVISEDPLPGTQVGLGSAVVLTVSLGAPSCVLPSVAGDGQAVALAVLAQLRADDGGRCGLLTESTGAPSATAPPGSVTGQDPAAGAAVAPGSAVTLTVSSGPPASAGPSASPGTPSGSAPPGSAPPSPPGTPIVTPPATSPADLAGSGAPSG